MKRKLSSAQAYIVTLLSETPNSRIVRDEFLGRRYYFDDMDGGKVKISESTVSSLMNMGMLNMSERDNLKYYYTLKNPLK